MAFYHDTNGDGVKKFRGSENPDNTLPTYAWAFDALGNMESSTETLGLNVESTSYASDSTGQHTVADHDFQTDEAYSYGASKVLTLMAAFVAG